ALPIYQLLHDLAKFVDVLLSDFFADRVAEAIPARLHFIIDETVEAQECIRKIKIHPSVALLVSCQDVACPSFLEFEVDYLVFEVLHANTADDAFDVSRLQLGELFRNVYEQLWKSTSERNVFEELGD